MSNQKKDHWNQTGKGYNTFWKTEAKKIIDKRELSFINRYADEIKPIHALDIGMGTGRILKNYLNIPTIKEIFGIDIAESMVKVCKTRFKNERRIKKIQVCDISKDELPFSQKFDLLSAIRVLKYNKNWKEIVSKLVNQLNPRGIFVFTIPNKRAFMRFTSPEIPIYSTTKKEIELLCQDLHLEPLEITSFSKLPDVFYDLANNEVSVRVLITLEKILKIFFGDILFGREFFVIVRKRFPTF